MEGVCRSAENTLSGSTDNVSSSTDYSSGSGECGERKMTPIMGVCVCVKPFRTDSSTSSVLKLLYLNMKGQPLDKLNMTIQDGGGYMMVCP